MKHLSRILAVVVFFTLSSCTNDPEPVGEQQLVVTSSNPDSVINPSMPITFDLIVRANSKPVEGARVIVTKPNGVNDTMTTMTGADGHVVYTEAEFSGAVNQWNIYSFRAIKDGSKTSTRYVRHVRVLQQLMLTVQDTITVYAGLRAEVKLTVTEPPSTPVSNAAVKIENSIGNVVATPSTNLTGEVVFEVPTNPQDFGTLTFKATASKVSFANSATKTFTVNVIRIPPPPPAVFYFSSLSSHSIGIRWEEVDDGRATFTVNAYQQDSSVAIWTHTTKELSAILDLPSVSGVVNFGISVDGGPEGKRRRWATAKRLPLETNGEQTIRIWQTGTPSNIGGAGLIVDPTGLRVVDIESADSSKVDLVLATIPDSPELPLMLISPGAEGSGIDKGRTTMFAPLAWEFIGTLNEDYYQESLEAMIPVKDPYNVMLIPHRAAPNPQMCMILPLIFQGGHYSRVEIVPQSNGQIYGMQGDYRFVDVRISYQELDNTPFAGRPQVQKPHRKIKPVSITRK